ncbi:MAG: hypothetical protein JWQ88_3081 [Rhodoferax sp.]|nr:hypothetical protein [Rhodoferax sp.]
MQNPDIQALADALCRQAGLIGPYGKASRQMVELMQLTAGRCLDILGGPAQGAPQYAEIARRFGAASTVDSQPGHVHCKAVLHGAPHLGKSDRHMAESIFVEAMRQKLGGMAPLFRDHSEWTDDPHSEGGRRWQAASKLAWLLVMERLWHASGKTVERPPLGDAHFDMEFIHEIA